MRPLFAHLSAESARIYSLTLSSAGIAHQIHPGNDRYTITVPDGKRRAAVRAVSLYRHENPSRKSERSLPQAIGIRTYSALFVAPVLALIHWAVMPGYEHQVFVETLGADADKIVSGAVYRCVTALLLHKDWPHVVNNIAGMVLFGTVTASICGWGVGWLMVLLSGAMGNLLTAHWYREAHMAIGASTAVFGAVGLCSALNLWRQFSARQPSWRMWLPLAGGLALLGFLGGSPHSDLMAHLAGFASGLMIGGGYGWLRRKPPGLPVQMTAAVLGCSIIAISWLYGVYY